MATASLNRILGHLGVSFSETSDADLLRAYLARRDSAAFAAIVRRHGPTVLSACRQVLRQEPDVEDAFQATFLVLLRNGHGIRSQQSLSSWLFGAAHRVAVHARCRRFKLESRERTNEELPHPSAESPDLSWREASTILHEELNRLPEKLRLPLLMCYLEGKSRDEAAAELNWSVGKLKGMLERGRIRLRDRLQRRGIALGAGLLAAVDVATGACVPPSWVESVVSFSASGGARPAVAALTRGVISTTSRFKTAALAAVILIVTGTLIAASTSADPTPFPKKDAPAVAAKEKRPVPEKLIVTGKVTDADGKPVGGAKLYVPILTRTPPVSEDDVGTKVVGETAADGTFKVEIEKTEISRYLIVGAADHAIGWANLEKATGAHEATVTLVKDVPVEGRVIDTEGKPVAGAEIKVMSVFAPAAGKLDAFLTGWKNDWSDALRLVEDRMYMPLAPIHGSGKTDANGKFTVRGIGAERIGVLEVSRTGYAKETVYAITRSGLDAGPINKAAHDKIPIELRIPGQPPMLAGPKADLVLQGTKVIEGTVTDAETGKPVVGISIMSGSGYNSQVSTTSDKNGKYRLVGLVKNREYLLHTATRDSKSTYLMWSARVGDSEGLAPIRHDIQMTKGVVLVVRMIDPTTGKPVRGSVRLAPLPDNKFFGAKPAYNGYSTERFSHSSDDSSGKVRIVTIPGLSVIVAQANSGEKVSGKEINPFTPAVPDPDFPNYFTKNGEGGYTFAAAGNSVEFLDIANACKVIDLKPDAGEMQIDLKLERGKTTTLKVVDADGKPLSGATVAGLAAWSPTTYMMTTDTATVYALQPGKPRTLMLLHVEKKLGAAIEVKAEEPATVKLLPLGSVTGKLVDTDGRPIAGVTVGIQFPGGPGGGLYRETQLTRVAPVTDKDGAFRVEGVVPGVKFYLSMTKGQEYFVGEPRIGLKEVESGKTLDLGSVPVKARRFGE